jgi:hypothetical protein
MLRGNYYRWMFCGACCVAPAVIDRTLSRPAASRPRAFSLGFAVRRRPIEPLRSP